MTTVTSDLEQLRRRSRNRRLLGLFVKRIVILVTIVIVLAPGYFIVLASLQPGSSFFSGTLLPRNLSLADYRMLFNDTEFPTWVRNSMIVCTAVSLISTTCVALMAYAFARLRFFGRRYGLFGLLLIQIFPIGIAVSAYYFFLLKLTEWTDGHVGLETYSGLILLLSRHRDGVLRLALQGLYRLDAEGAGGGGLRRRSHPAAGPAVRDPPDGAAR